MVELLLHVPQHLEHIICCSISSKSLSPNGCSACTAGVCGTWHCKVRNCYIKHQQLFSKSSLWLQKKGIIGKEMLHAWALERMRRKWMENVKEQGNSWINGGSSETQHNEQWQLRFQPDPGRIQNSKVGKYLLQFFTTHSHSLSSTCNDMRVIRFKNNLLFLEALHSKKWGDGPSV